MLALDNKIKMYFKDSEGYKQLKNLENGRKLFEKALDSRGVDRKREGIQYSIGITPNGIRYTIIDNNIEIGIQQQGK